MRAFAIALALTVCACASGPRGALPAPALPQRASVDPIVAARAEGVRLIGEGENFRLRFYDRVITLQIDGADLRSFPRPEPRYPRWDGEIYETSNGQHRLSVAVRRDRPCPADRGLHRIEVRLDGRELSGCGRAL